MTDVRHELRKSLGSRFLRKSLGLRVIRNGTRSTGKGWIEECRRDEEGYIIQSIRHAGVLKIRKVCNFYGIKNGNEVSMAAKIQEAGRMENTEVPLWRKNLKRAFEEAKMAGCSGREVGELFSAWSNEERTEHDIDENERGEDWMDER